MEVEAEVMAEENRIIMADLAIMDPVILILSFITMVFALRDCLISAILSTIKFPFG
jgi:hypothetical protein